MNRSSRISRCTSLCRHPQGGFYSAEDADSLPTATSAAKREGAFCVWTKEELDRILPGEPVAEGTTGTKAELFCRVYGVKDGGNVDPRLWLHHDRKNI